MLPFDASTPKCTLGSIERCRLRENALRVVSSCEILAAVVLLVIMATELESVCDDLKVDMNSSNSGTVMKGS